VDYEERLYAAGKIPGGFFRREGRPTEAAILLCRLTDRPLRPLFPKGFRNDVQIVITSLSADRENFLDILSIVGASAALTISDIPFDGPVGAVRVGYIDGEFVFNPTASEMTQSSLDLRLAGTEKAILMVEANAHQVPEELIVEAIEAGHEAMQEIIAVQHEMAAKVGKPKRQLTVFEVDEDVRAAVLSRLDGRIPRILEETESKEARNEALESLRDELLMDLQDTVPAEAVVATFDEALKGEVRRRILEKGVRPDGRDPQTIRPISCEVGLSPRTHGSGLFTRGETQVLTIATLGTPREEQMLDGLQPEETKRFMHHYNFPPFSTGETWPIRGPRRREIGHGALAEGALLPVLPEEEDFPYTIRLVSEVLSSNGSTSMASVCGSTLALMDAGVPISDPVAGIAMGLIKEGDRHVVLTDIIGMEDALGDMDFKVAGTAKGITALQMDIKRREGVDYGVMEEALVQAREARMFILDKMLEVIPAPRETISKYAPRIITIQIDPDKIGAVIGPGGKTIRKITEETDTKIDIEDDGTVYVASTEAEGADRAIEMIRALTEEPEVGRIYTGKVVRVTDFGAFVEILPKVDGMVHISQLADYRVNRVEDVVRVGDEVMVMVIDIDREGKIRLSRRAVLEGWTPEEARAADRRSRGGGGRKPRKGGGGSKRRSTPRRPTLGERVKLP
jgi:polyribonucleotide nucleotidyltransferase